MRPIWTGSSLENETIWRYMKLDYFLEILKAKELYFAAATQFDDNYEGAVAVMAPDFPVDPRYQEMDYADHAFFQLKRLTKIQCWHRADYESDAMWKLYASGRKGVAICSTPSRFLEAAQPFRIKPNYGVEDLWYGHVLYKDLSKERLKVGMLERFFYKHKAFSWENEFRFAISLRSAEEFAVPVPEFGIKVSVDLDVLIENIVIGPSLTNHEVESLNAAVRNVGLEKKILKTSLLGAPRYF